MHACQKTINVRRQPQQANWFLACVPRETHVWCGLESIRAWRSGSILGRIRLLGLIRSSHPNNFLEAMDCRYVARVTYSLREHQRHQNEEHNISGIQGAAWMHDDGAESDLDRQKQHGTWCRLNLTWPNMRQWYRPTYQKSK